MFYVPSRFNKEDEQGLYFVQNQIWLDYSSAKIVSANIISLMILAVYEVHRLQSR